MVSKLEMDRLESPSISFRRRACITLWTQLQVRPSTTPVSWHFLQVNFGSSASAGRPLAASKGKRTMAAVTHELKVWRAEGVETGEQADAHLKLLALRAQREQYVSGLLGIPDSELTLGGRKAIARWYEVYGYDDAMVQEVAVQAGPKRDLWYWNSILKTWNAKGLRTIHDVRGPVAEIGASRNIRVDRTAPSGNDFLKNSSLTASLNRLKKKSTP